MARALIRVSRAALAAFAVLVHGCTLAIVEPGKSVTVPVTADAAMLNVAPGATVIAAAATPTPAPTPSATPWPVPTDTPKPKSPRPEPTATASPAPTPTPRVVYVEVTPPPQQPMPVVTVPCEMLRTSYSNDAGNMRTRHTKERNEMLQTLRDKGAPEAELIAAVNAQWASQAGERAELVVQHNAIFEKNGCAPMPTPTPFTIPSP